MHFHLPHGMFAVQFSSNRCHISTSLWGRHTKTASKGGTRGEKKQKNKEQRNDQESLLKAAGGIMSDLTCYNACTQTIALNNGEDVVTTALCIKYSQDLWLYFSSPSFLLPSRFSLLNNKGSNWCWTRFSIETSHCAFALRLKRTIKVVRWAHYDLLVLSRSHQS